METIIEEQEKKFDKKFPQLPPKEGEKQLYMVSSKVVDFKALFESVENHKFIQMEKNDEIKPLDNYTTKNEIKEWHKNSIKQILQALVEREEKEILTRSNGEELADTTLCFNQAKQDTIQYLQEQIKKL